MSFLLVDSVLPRRFRALTTAHHFFLKNIISRETVLGYAGRFTARACYDGVDGSDGFCRAGSSSGAISILHYTISGVPVRAKAASWDREDDDDMTRRRQDAADDKASWQIYKRVRGEIERGNHVRVNVS